MIVTTLLFLTFVAFALWGWATCCWFVAVRTNNRWTGWLVYVGIMAIPTYAMFHVAYVTLVALAARS